MSDLKESLAAEFQRLHDAWQKAWELESDQIAMPISDERFSEVGEFATEHGVLIARALRMLEIVDNAPTSSILTREPDKSEMILVCAAFREAVK